MIKFNLRELRDALGEKNLEAETQKELHAGEKSKEKKRTKSEGDIIDKRRRKERKKKKKDKDISNLCRTMIS